MNLTNVLDWLVREALGDTPGGSLLSEFCRRLEAAGLPLLRVNLAMRTLHPLVASVDITWVRGQGLDVHERAHSSVPADMWLRSPLYWMMTHRKQELRQRLDVPAALEAFPVFRELRDLGATDYLALLTAFGDAETAIERQDGILTSWVTDAAGGFSDADIQSLRQVQPYLGLVAKLTKRELTARNVVCAYLGNDAGQRVLDGQIRLGDVEQIPAVIWYSDLRNSTAMAERMPVESFFAAVNDYFECTAGAVLEHGGEVLRFIGDAVLAVFPIGAAGTPAAAARQSFAAACSARHRMSDLNERRADARLETLSFGLGLHVGEILYGNIGVPSRIEFSVIGPTANEVCRLESLTKEAGESVIVSRAFSQALAMPCRLLGRYQVKGIGKPLEVYAPPPE